MQVLVSVNSVAEARLVLAAGVPLIDLKDTSHGALAALDLENSAAIMAAVKAHRQQSPVAAVTISATVGDGCASVADLIALIAQRLHIGIEVIKLPEAIWADANYQAVINDFIAQGARIIAVFMPHSLADAILETRLLGLAQQGYWGVMVDTTEKSTSLMEMVSMPVLARFVHAARSLHLYVGLAGGLSLAHVAPLSALQPDYLGFRSGLCVDGQRAQGLLAERIQKLLVPESEDLLEKWSISQ